MNREIKGAERRQAYYADAATWADVHPLYVERSGPDGSAIGPPQEYLDAHQE